MFSANNDSQYADTCWESPKEHSPKLNVDVHYLCTANAVSYRSDQDE